MRGSWIGTGMAVWLLVVGTTSAQDTAVPSTMAIRAARRIDAKGDAMVKDGVVVVEGEKIKAVAQGWRFPRTPK